MVAWRQNVLVEGRPLLTLGRGINWLAHCSFNHPARIRISPSGPVLVIPPRLKSYGSTSIYMKRLEYEPFLQILAALSRPGDYILDIGANMGIYSTVLAAKVGPKGRVYAFEPSAEALERLRTNIAENPDLNIEVVPTGLSNSEREATLYHIGGPATYSLGGSGAGETVNLVPLDLWSEQISEPIALVKMDVEGHEPDVIRGGSASLASWLPIVMFEVSADALARSGHGRDASWRLLQDLGFNFYQPSASHLVPTSTLSDGNFLAVHPESPYLSRLNEY